MARIQQAFYPLLNILLSRIVNKPVILTFHRVKVPSNTVLDRRIGVTDPGEFQKIMKFMKVLGYRFVSLERLLKSTRDEGLSRLAVVTFDDGFLDLYHIAYPILKALKAPFTLFLTTTNVNSEKLLWQHKLYYSIERLSPEQKEKVFVSNNLHFTSMDDMDALVGSLFMSKNKMGIEKLVEQVVEEAGISQKEEKELAEQLYLTKDNLLKMKGNGFSIEVHGHAHWPLSNLNREETEEEVIESVDYLVNELNTRPHFYALTFGVGNQYINSILFDLGFAGLLTSKNRLITRHEDPYDLPRMSKLVSFSAFNTILFRMYQKRFASRRSGKAHT